MIKVHGVPLSPFVRKVHFALRHKGLDFEINPVMPGDDSEAFGKISPLRKVPVLEHDGFTAPDSSIILRYLDQVFPDKSIYPSDPKQQAQACWLEEYGDTKVVENAAPIFFQRVVRPTFFNEETDESIVADKINNELPPVLGYLEGVLPDSGFALGNDLTIADFSIVSPLLNARYGGYTPDAAAFPKLAAYIDRVTSTGPVETQLAVEKEMFNLG